MASTSTAIDEGTVFGLAVAAMWQCPRFCFHSDCFADEMWNNGSPEDLRWPTTICDRISTRITIYTCSLHRRRIRFTTYYFQPNAISYVLFSNSSNERATVIVHRPNTTPPPPQLDETNIFISKYAVSTNPDVKSETFGLRFICRAMSQLQDRVNKHSNFAY